MVYSGITAKAGGLISGTDVCKQSIEKHKTKLILLAEDASERTKNTFIELGKKYNTNLVIFENINTLSNAIGKENRAIICIENESLANEIFKIINGGTKNNG